MRGITMMLCGGLLLGAAAPAWPGNTDAKLLDMLRANGSITAAQHEELMADLQREERVAAKAAKKGVKKEEFVTLQQKLGWALNTQIKGDVRVRHETIDIEGKSPKRDKDRQRIRARIGAFTQVNPEVEAGIQVASGSSSDKRSTNQDLDATPTPFDKKELWLDLTYIDYHPLAVPGLKVFGGKMKQPWVSLGDTIWDGDINPEGMAGTYSRKWGTTELFGSAGVFILKNNVDGDGNQFRHDLGLNSGQMGVRFFPGDDFKVTLGGSIYHYTNDEDTAALLTANGNTTTEFQLYEGFGQVDVLGLPLPLSVYGQVVTNADANGAKSDQDLAWLVGVLTRLWDIGIDYNYRDVQRNAVVGAFTDSDFASGFTASRGHKLKLKYDIAKNFSIGATYFLTKSDASDTIAPFELDADTNTLQVDLEAKF